MQSCNRRTSGHGTTARSPLGESRMGMSLMVHIDKGHVLASLGRRMCSIQAIPIPLSTVIIKETFKGVGTFSESGYINHESRYLLSKKTESCLIFTSDSPERPPLFFRHQHKRKLQLLWPQDYEVCLTLPTAFAILLTE